jgi:hypothetical protein
MKYWRTTEGNCPSCHGRGEVFETSYRGRECWVTSMECHCVTHHHDDEMKAFLASIPSTELQK